MNKLAAMFLIPVGAGLLLLIPVIAVMFLQGSLHFYSDDVLFLDTPSWGDSVTMFKHIHYSKSEEFVTFPDSTKCTYLSGPRLYDVGDGGPAISYYKLECEGHTGYIRDEYVSRWP